MNYNVDKLVRARQLKGWTRTYLAAMIGRSEAAICRIENGERGGEKTIFLMANALSVPMAEILEPAELAAPGRKKNK